MKFETINSYFDNIYVITLERDIQRQEHIIKDLEGLNFSFFYGTDKKNLVMDELIEEGTYDEIKAINNHRFDKPMNTGQIGCSWSHRLVYEDMLEKKYKRILILEDQVIPKKEGFEAFEDTLQTLPEDWELLYLDCDINLTRNLGTWFRQLSCHIRHFFRKLKWNHTVINNLYARKYSDNLLIAGMHDSTDAYAITNSAAKKLIHLQKPISYLSGGLLAHACTNKLLRAYVFKPGAFQMHMKLKAKSLID
ncbi:MAG: glycosyltransferase family 25 protein [Chitinophagaceae bacterium]|nr:glycosyltransferase family 25 protein [Chitinophagaceae bacterium]